jgi:hypothetical protein
MRTIFIPLFLTIYCFSGSQDLHGQAFIFNQFFQPSIRLNVEVNPDGVISKNPAQQLAYNRANLNLILPIKSKLGVKVDVIEAIDKLRNLRKLRLKDVGDVARVKMYQIFWNIRPQTALINYQTTADTSVGANLEQTGNRQLFGLSTGITGLHLIKRMRILFYSANVGFLEDKNTLRRLQPNFTGLIGAAHLNRVVFVWYYGAYISYNNGRFIPAPFFGIEANLMEKLWLNITLPVQMRLGWSFSKKTKLDFVMGLAGYGGGFGYQNPNSTDWQRGVFTTLQARTSLVFNWKLNRQTKMYLEFGALPFRQLSVRMPYPLPTGVTAQKGSANQSMTVYGGFSLFYAFQKSLLSSVVDGLISF